jgi:hypothetical protein
MSYTVGVDESNQTVLKVGPDGGLITTMTMSEKAVIQMIRLLAATIDVTVRIEQPEPLE